MYTFPPIRKLPRALASSVPHRTLWACRTYLSSEPGSLLTELKRRHSTPSSTTTTPSSPATLFCLSKSVPFSYLSDIHTHLTNQGHTVLGALTESPTSSTPSTQPYSLSLATFTPSSNLTSALRVYPLHSTLLGRPNISLGREHKSSPVDSHDQDQLSEAALGAFLRGEQGWSFGMTNQGSNSSQSHESVDGIEKRLQGLERIDPRNVKQLIYITSDRSTPLLQLLSTTYAKTQKLGLTASSTPFHSPTGEPFTLITPDGQVHSTGAVGLAIVDEANVSTSTRTPTMGKGVQVGYEGLVPFGLGEEKAFEVTSSRGNIVLTLSSQNAARLLLNAVNALQNPSLQKTSTTSTSSSPRPKPWSTSQSQKNQPFYAGVFASKPWNGINLSQASFVCRLMAGDPSRGMMSLDTEKDVRVGDWVVFLRHKPSISSSTATTTTTTSLRIPLFQFLSLPQSDALTSTTHDDPSTPSSSSSSSLQILPHFFAASENGVIVPASSSFTSSTANVGGGGGDDWVCSIEGTWIGLGEQ